jgi:hypothetical protein
VTTKEPSLMPNRIRRPPGLAGGLILVAVASLLLAGCGGSSKSATNAAATTTTNGQGGGAARFTALRTCLAKNGITLPQPPAGRTRPPGGAPGVGGIFGGGGAGRRGFQLPSGVSQAKFQAALAKCGGPRAGLGRPGGARPALTPAQKAAQQASLVKFAACMRTNGIALPAPNTSGTGPVFNTSKLNTTSPQFTAATKKCAPLLPARFGRRAGGGPGRPGTTTTPTTTTPGPTTTTP